MFAFLKRTFLILLGFLFIVVFVWYAGPYFGFGPYHPLEPVNARLIAIGVVVGIWFLRRLWRRFRAYRASDRLLAAVVAQPQPEAARPSADALKLRERFEEAVGALKKQRRDGHSLYDLPWYVIIGAPGSGKTTALLNSGLKFPLEQRVGKGALRGVGGTRNCDWWFTDEAIFLDTAGRYTTQDSDSTSDSAGWSEFLALLKKYRARRPVNGVILTINAQDLIVQGAAAREAHVEAARRRLDELNRELRIQLPVYLMVTKCDLVAGFAEYFDDLTPEGRAQVWGVTFPYEQTLRNETPQAFPEEFDALMIRLNERVFARVEEVRDPRRRTRVFAFPQQMAATREALTQFVTEVFASSQFDRQILLRGVYFTSGTQEGTPIDRLIGSIGRRFGATESVVPSSGPGKAYFVESLLKDVLIAESGLAGVDRRLETRKAAAQLGAYAATGLVAATGVAALSVSYSRNRGYLEQTATEVAAFAQTPRVNATSPLESIVPRLEAIAAIVDSSEAYRADTTWAMRWGLYQGRSVGDSARDAYMRELDSILLPRVAAQIRERLAQSSGDPENLYLYLKGYLMLGEPGHLDKDHLQTLAEREWGLRGTNPALSQALSKHLHNLLENGDSLRPLPLDGTLVAQARSSIRQTSMPRIVYDALKRASSEGAGGASLQAQAGIDVEKVLRRRSGVALSAPLPRFYTREVFKETLSATGRANLVNVLGKDAWVWGDNLGTSLAGAGTLVSTVTTLYEQDYMREWDALLDDLEFVSFTTIAQTNEALRIITGPASPLRGILRVVGDNTALVETAATPAASGAIEGAKKTITETFGRAVRPLQNAAGLPTVAPGTLVTAHFQWVRQLTAGEAGKTPLDGIIKTIGDIQRQLDAIGPDAAGADPGGVFASPAFRALTQTLRQQSEALPPGLRHLIDDIGRGTTTAVKDVTMNEIEARYAQDLRPTCTTMIANRYPFAASSTAEVQLTDFATLFAHDGLFDKFFADHMEKFVDTSATPWTWREGTLTGSRRLLDLFRSAFVIRDTFFAAGGKTPELKFFATTSDLDRETTRFVLQVDGQLTEDKHGAPVKWPLTWPGPTPGPTLWSFTSPFFEPPHPYGGPWALFKMIDGTVEGQPDGQQRIRLNIRSPHHHVYVTVEAARSYNNPFASREWRTFSCES